MTEESFDVIRVDVMSGGFTRKQALSLISELFSQLADMEPSDD